MLNIKIHVYLQIITFTKNYMQLNNKFPIDSRIVHTKPTLSILKSKIINNNKPLPAEDKAERTFRKSQCFMLFFNVEHSIHGSTESSHTHTLPKWHNRLTIYYFSSTMNCQPLKCTKVMHYFCQVASRAELLCDIFGNLRSLDKQKQTLMGDKF